jgi:hypothetical protein
VRSRPRAAGSAGTPAKHGYEQFGASLLLFTDAGAGRGPIARQRTLAARPKQARARQRVKRPHPVLKRESGGVSLDAPPPAQITEPGLRHTHGGRRRSTRPHPGCACGGSAYGPSLVASLAARLAAMRRGAPAMAAFRRSGDPHLLESAVAPRPALPDSRPLRAPRPRPLRDPTRARRHRPPGASHPVRAIAITEPLLDSQP